MPFIGNRTRITLTNEYLPAADHKALATTINGVNAFAVGQASEEAAKTAAIEQCLAGSARRATNFGTLIARRQGHSAPLDCFFHFRVGP